MQSKNRIKKKYPQSEGRNDLRFFVLLLIPILLSGCGYYSFKGALPSHIQSIAIPLFNDNTPNPGVRENLTNMVIDEFISDNTLQVVDETKADLILTGEIRSIRDQASVVTGNEVVSESKVVVNVRVKCEDVRMSKILFEKSIQQYGLLDASAGLEERNAAIEEALQLITEDILNSTLGGW